MQRRRALVVQRTGWGKSAVYFIAAKLLRAAGHGPTVIVSPLLALMRNQVAAAERAGVHAATINSSNVADWDEIHDRVRRRRTRRPAGQPGTVEQSRLSRSGAARAGARRRAGGGRRGALRVGLGPRLPARLPAHPHADRRTRHRRPGAGHHGHRQRPGGRRRRRPSWASADGTPWCCAAGWTASRCGCRWSRRATRRSARLGLPHTSIRCPGSGIVYTLTVAQAHDVAALLREQGHEVAAYTGSTEAAEREQLEADLLANRVKALIATSALGMGFDKPDLGFVVHLGAPSSPIAYYQQVGRAGRSTASAEVVLLPGHEDQDVWRYFASVAFPSEAMVRNVIRRARTRSAAVDARAGAAGRPGPDPAGDGAEGARRRRRGAARQGRLGRHRRSRGSTTRPRYRKLDEARKREQQAMLDYQATDGCRMAFLRGQLDDPELATGERCGRCDNCTGERATTPTSTRRAAEDTRQRLMRPGVEITPRKQWPSGLAKLGVDLSGKIGDGPAPGRVDRQADRPGLGRAAAAPARRTRRRGVRRRGAGRGEGAGVVGLGRPADRGDGAGLRPPPAADLVAGARAGPARQADRPRHPAVRAGAPAGDRGELGLPRRRAARLVAGARSGRRSRPPAARCCSSTT